MSIPLPAPHNPDKVVLMLITWFNDILIPNIHRRYVYAGDDINSNVGEPSKSYIQGQFYIDEEYNKIYLSYILDPNIIWNNPAISPSLYDQINQYITEQSRNNIDTGLKIEVLNAENSITEYHEARSKCRTEELTRYLYDDTIFLWRALDGQYRFIRDSSKLTQWKHNLFIEQNKVDFSDYTQQVSIINNTYNFKNDNDTLPIGFEVYKTLVRDYFGKDVIVIDPSKITKFYLLDFTDYSIKEDYA